MKNSLNINSELIATQENRFGKVYIHEYNYRWGAKKYRVFDMYFQVEQKFCKFKYNTLSEIYDTHLSDATYIYNSFKLK